MLTQGTDNTALYFIPQSRIYIILSASFPVMISRVAHVKFDKQFFFF